MGTQHMQRKQHTAQQGERRDFYLFSPSSPGISKPWPQLSVLPAQDSRGAEWADGLECGAQAQVRLCWVSSMVFYWSAWLASGVPPVPRHCLPGQGWLPGAWCTFSLSSEVVPMTCLSDEWTAVGLFSSWSKKTKAEQKGERGSTCPSGAGSLPIYGALLSGRAIHTAFFPGSLVHDLSGYAGRRSACSLCSPLRAGPWQRREDKCSVLPGSPQMFSAGSPPHFLGSHSKNR